MEFLGVEITKRPKTDNYNSRPKAVRQQTLAQSGSRQKAVSVAVGVFGPPPPPFVPLRVAGTSCFQQGSQKSEKCGRLYTSRIPQFLAFHIDLAIQFTYIVINVICIKTIAFYTRSYKKCIYHLFLNFHIMFSTKYCI